ncbi:DEKNAAC102497 [Brettanomyces naardenensis]|uniref:DEKNAAC102497 n=1 Tax=Brettanomyces naardenensis TaxID=13370 RepID=A0A448YKQ0_BRENA|nr:DEKNAAC102497 [Brettanomyces naardenensis]
MSFETPVHSASVNNSFFTPSDDTFLAAKRRSNKEAGDERVKTSNTIELSRSDRSDLFKGGNPVKPTSGITPYTPIKSLVSSPFKSKVSVHRNEDLSLDSSTPLDVYLPNSSPAHTSLLLSSPHFPNRDIQDDGQQHSMLKQKVRKEQEHNIEQSSRYLSPQQEENKTLFSTIYERSVFKSRRPTSDAARLLSPERTFNLSPYTAAEDGIRRIPGTTVPPASGSSNEDDNRLASPYTEIALGRIINKDYEGRKLLITILVLLAYRFLLALIKLLAIRFELRKLPIFVKHGYYVLQVANYLRYGIYAVICLSIAISVVRLVKPQDKCLDLPLTNKQRKLLGLPLVSGNSTHDDIDEEPTISPRRTNRNQSNPTVLSPPSLLSSQRVPFESLDSSFANMNLSTPGLARLPVSSRTKSTAVSAPSITSPQEIKERLLSSRKRQLDRTANLEGNHSSESTPNTSFKRPSNKFIYDMTNDDSTNNSFSAGLDTSFY